MLETQSFRTQNPQKPDVMCLAVHSLTNPAIFYFLTALSAALLVLGIVLFIIFWVVFNTSKSGRKWKKDCRTIHRSPS